MYHPIADQNSFNFNLDSLDDTMINLNPNEIDIPNSRKNIFDEKNSNETDDDFFANGSVLPDKPLATAPKRNVAIKKEIKYISDDDF